MMMETEKLKASQVNAEQAHDLKLLQQMLLIRRFEERSAELYTQGKIRGFLHLYVGEEAVAVGVIQALRDDDYVLSNYREHGHALARGVDPGKIMAEMFGRQEGCSHGRGGSMHLFDVSKNFLGGNAIVAGHLPLSLGIALASKKQRKHNIVCCFFGEGAAAEGEFHEVMNLAGLWQVPLLLVCENNLYAMGTAIRYTHAVQDLDKRGAVYGIESASIDGMDVLAVEEAVKKAVNIVRTTGKPFFLVCNTYRFRAHSMFDSEMYREKSEVEAWKQKDPIKKLQQILVSEGTITELEIGEMKTKIEAQLQQAIDFAEKGTWEPVSNLTKYVYSEY